MIDAYSPCSCGSGKKYKFCCYQKNRALSAVEPRQLFQNSAQFPVALCLVSEGWEESGLASVLLSRGLPSGRYLFALYCVDVFCLGVKEVLFKANVELSVVQSLVQRFPESMMAIDYEDARSLVLGAVEFAQTAGFDAHPDWQLTRGLLEPDLPFVPKFEFGKDGKPLYVPGPYDDPNLTFRARSKNFGVPKPLANNP